MVYLHNPFYIFCPTLWVNYTLGKHDDELQICLSQFRVWQSSTKRKEITNVSILGDDKIGDHYDVINKSRS